MNPEAAKKLEKLKAASAANKARTGGGKGVPRRVQKPVTKSSSAGDDKKLQAQFKKLNVQEIGGIEEVNMFKDDGSVLHFTAPKVQANGGSATCIVFGAPSQKELTELVPGILNQLGPEALANLKQMASQYQANSNGAAAVEEDDDDDVPELVETFEETSNN